MRGTMLTCHRPRKLMYYLGNIDVIDVLVSLCIYVLVEPQALLFHC